MSENDTKKEDGATFDIYHFFSRKDVILAGLVIIGLLLFALFKFLSGNAIV